MSGEATSGVKWVLHKHFGTVDSYFKVYLYDEDPRVNKYVTNRNAGSKEDYVLYSVLLHGQAEQFSTLESALEWLSLQ
jgi:hypothetical protein